MYKNLYSVYDVSMKEYGPILEAKNDEVAERMFYQMLQKIEDWMRKDYVLYKLGSFDTESGLIVSTGPIMAGDYKLIYDEVYDCKKQEVVK